MWMGEKFEIQRHQTIAMASIQTTHCYSILNIYKHKLQAPGNTTQEQQQATATNKQEWEAMNTNEQQRDTLKIGRAHV